MHGFITIVVQGLSVGSIYALLALGFAMIYSVSLMSNFAHGDFAMIGVMLFLILLPSSGLLIAAIAVVPLIAGAVAVTTAVVVYRPVLKSAKINSFICAIGVSIFLENLAIVIWGPESRAFPTLGGDSYISIEGVRFRAFDIALIGVLALLTLAVTLYIKYTKFGIASRALSEDAGAARLMGIPVNSMIYLTFAIGGILSGISGLSYAMYFGIAWPLMGFAPILKAFVCTVAGGLGSLPGAVLGGLILGVLESVGGRYISTGYEDAISFGILIVILLVRPQGLLGRKVNVKV
jgi:branched-chain amino acid transport system permease protein